MQTKQQMQTSLKDFLFEALKKPNSKVIPIIKTFLLEKDINSTEVKNAMEALKTIQRNNRNEKEESEHLINTLLANCAVWGIGFSPDEKALAFNICKSASEQKYPLAQYVMARCLAWSFGCKKDLNASIKHYQFAAEAGIVSAQRELALIYEKSKIKELQKDPEKASELYNMANKKSKIIELAIKTFNEKFEKADVNKKENTRTIEKPKAPISLEELINLQTLTQMSNEELREERIVFLKGKSTEFQKRYKNNELSDAEYLEFNIEWHKRQIQIYDNRCEKKFGQNGLDFIKSIANVRKRFGNLKSVKQDEFVKNMTNYLLQFYPGQEKEIISYNENFFRQAKLKLAQFFAREKEQVQLKSFEQDGKALNCPKETDYKSRLEKLKRLREAEIELGQRSQDNYVRLKIHSLVYQKEKYDFINTRINFVERSTGLASVGKDRGREIILVAKEDEKKILEQWEKFYAAAKKEHGEPIELERKLLLVNQFTKGALKKNIPQDKYRDIEELRQENFKRGKAIRLPNEDFSRTIVFISEFLDKKCGVCRHHSIINAIILKHLIQTNLLPEGEVRQMRDTLWDDTKDKQREAHAVITYIPKTGGIWVLDSLNFERPFPIEHSLKLEGVHKKDSDQFKIFGGRKFYNSFIERLKPANRNQNKCDF